MKDANKWTRRSKAELKLCWYVVVELFTEYLPAACRWTEVHKRNVTLEAPFAFGGRRSALSLRMLVGDPVFHGACAPPPAARHRHGACACACVCGTGRPAKSTSLHPPASVPSLPA